MNRRNFKGQPWGSRRGAIAFLSWVFLVLLRSTVVYASCTDLAVAPTFQNGGWEDIGKVDLPKQSLGNSDVTKIEEVERTLASYRGVPKHDLSSRVEALSHLIESAHRAEQSLSQSADAKVLTEKIQNVIRMAQTKRDYLHGLLGIPRTIRAYLQVRDSLWVPPTLEGALAATEQSAKSLQSVDAPAECGVPSEKKLGDRISVVIPNYEADVVTQLDPAHRDASCLSALFKEYASERKIESNRPTLKDASDFYTWLEVFDLPLKQRDLIIRFRENREKTSALGSCFERQDHRTTVAGRRVTFGPDGTAYSAYIPDEKAARHICDSENKRISQVLDGKYIYNIDEAGQLYIDHDRDLGGSRLLGHILITGKFAIPAAGEVEFKDGKDAAELLKEKNGSNIFSENCVIRNHLNDKTLLVFNSNANPSKK
jgi:hypothetical protein